MTVLDNWGNGGKNFTRTIPFDQLKAVMSKAEVDAKRAAGLLADSYSGIGFFLLDAPPPAAKPKAEADPSRSEVHGAGRVAPPGGEGGQRAATLPDPARPRGPRRRTGRHPAGPFRPGAERREPVRSSTRSASMPELWPWR